MSNKLKDLRSVTMNFISLLGRVKGLTSVTLYDIDFVVGADYWYYPKHINVSDLSMHACSMILAHIHDILSDENFEI